MAKSEFAIIDIGEKGNGNSLYLDRTWKTKKLAEIERADLLKYHSRNNIWRKRLVVREHKSVPLIPNKGASKILSPEQELFTCLPKEIWLNAKTTGYILGSIIAWPVSNFEHDVNIFPVLIKFVAKKTQVKINRRAVGFEKYKRYIDKLYLDDVIEVREI